MPFISGMHARNLIRIKKFQKKISTLYWKPEDYHPVPSD